MKKVFSMALVLMLCLGLSTTALAAEITDTEDGNTDTHDITAAVAIAKDIVYAVDIVWDDMNFTYSDTRTWNPERLEYGGNAGWNGEKWIYVTNRSNASIYSIVTATLNTGEYPGLGTTSVYFVNPANGINLAHGSQYHMSGDRSVLIIGSADNAFGEDGQAVAPYGNRYLELTGAPTEEMTGAVIGSLTVTIASEYMP